MVKTLGVSLADERMKLVDKVTMLVDDGTVIADERVQQVGDWRYGSLLSKSSSSQINT